MSIDAFRSLIPKAHGVVTMSGDRIRFCRKHRVTYPKALGCSYCEAGDPPSN